MFNRSHAVLSLRDVAEIMTDRGHPMCLQYVDKLERKALTQLRMELLDVGLEMGLVKEQKLMRPMETA